MAAWQTLDHKLIYENPWSVFHEDIVLNPVGQKVTYGIMGSKQASVFVVPIDEDGNTYIVKQYRYPIHQDSWEVVAGGVDPSDIEAGAKRELLEETGLVADKLAHLGVCHPATGRTTFECQIYIATDIRKVSDDLDQTDGISDVKKLSLNEAVDMIMRGEITCSQSIASLTMAREYLSRRRAS